MRKAFTLVEVIAVLIIISFIVLISIPIINNIIDKSKQNASKRSIDNYAHAIELAQSVYKMEHGYYTYDINDLKIEYSGKKVICDDIVLNENGSIYVSKCKIDDFYVEDLKSANGYYTYGTYINDYKIGDSVTYNNIEFFVVKDSVKSDDYLTLLKKTALYSSDIENSINDIDIYNQLNITNSNSPLYIKYLYDENCNTNNQSECSTDYNSSSVKKVIDGWAKNNLNDDDLILDKTGYKVRLLTDEDLFNNLKYRRVESMGTSGVIISYLSQNPNIYKIFNSSLSSSFTMCTYEDSISSVWYISNNEIREAKIYDTNLVRPVVNVKKSAIEE